MGGQSRRGQGPNLQVANWNPSTGYRNGSYPLPRRDSHSIRACLAALASSQKKNRREKKGFNLEISSAHAR